MEVLTKFQYETLQLNDELKSIADGSYLEDSNNSNFKEIKNQVFPGLSTAQVKLLNTGCGGGETIVGTYSSYVGKPKINYKFNIKPVIEDYITLNKICIGIDRKDNKTYIKNYSAKDHIRENGKDILFTFYRKEKTTGFTINMETQVEHYVLKQTFNGGECINELFLLDNYKKREGQKVSLSKLPETAHLKDIFKTNYSKIFFSFEDSGNSILKRSKKLIYAMDRKIASFEKEFLQYIEQIKIFNNIRISPEEIKNQKIDWTKKNYINDNGDKASIEIVKNINELLEAAIEYNEKEYERLSGISFVPKHFFGKEDKNGGNTGVAIIKRSGNFYKKVQEIRDIIEDLFLEIVKVIKGDETINWESIISYGEEEKLTEAEKALNLGIMSKRTAMKKVYNLSEEEIEKELNYISNESINGTENMNK